MMIKRKLLLTDLTKYSLENCPLPSNFFDQLEGKPEHQRTNKVCYKLPDWSKEQFQEDNWFLNSLLSKDKVISIQPKKDYQIRKRLLVSS